MAEPVTAAVAVGWGIRVLGWFAKPAISELYKKGSSILGFHASEKLKVLEPKVLLLQRAIELVEESRYRPYLEQLFNELKSTFHEAQDILDDVEYHYLDRQIHHDKFESADWLTVDKLWSALASSPLKDKVTGMSKRKLKKSLEKIEHMIDEAYKTVERLNLSNLSNGNSGEAIATSSHTTGTPPLKVIGRDEDRDRIIGLLHDNEGDGQPTANSGQPTANSGQPTANNGQPTSCYSVVGIHGISGSGKTTLAQLVYDKEKKHMQEKNGDHFDLVLWVHVSRKNSVAHIYWELIEAASHHLLEDNEMTNLLIRHENNNLDILQYQLENKLCGKRFFFLVLDDVWCNKDTSAQNLPQLLSPLNVGKSGSKVLVTCRNADALSDLGPDVKTSLFPIHDLNDDDFLKLFMYYALGERTDDKYGSILWSIGAQIAEKLKRSPLAARIVGGQLRKRKNVDFWRRAKEQDLLNETMGALLWSYQHLDYQVRQCFAYCSLFPGRHHLIRDELVRLWVAEGFIRNYNTGKEMEDLGHEYFEELVSISFLQSGTEKHYDYYIMHDLLHHLAERVAGTDYFRIDNGWKGDVPRGVRHLFVHDYNGEMLNKVRRNVELENLCTLIVSRDGSFLMPLQEDVLESMFKRLRKLRVLSIGWIWIKGTFELPANIGLLKNLRFLYLQMSGPSSKLLTLPRTFSKLYHMQVLDFDGCDHVQSHSDENIVNLVNLRYATTNLYYHLNISRLTSLQKLEFFSLRKDKLKQLRWLNKIQGSLNISNLDLVENKEEALEAKLADKGRLTKLELSWDRNVNPKLEADVLEGLCPPTCLEELSIINYSGTTYPNWMVDKQSGGPECLQELELLKCTQIGPVPELFEVFTHLRSFTLWFCDWDALPDTIQRLESLKKLNISACMSIRSLPALPKSLQMFQLRYCEEAFMRSCQTIGDPNWQKIQHIATRKFCPCLSSSPTSSNGLKGVTFDDNVSIIGA